MYQKEKLHFNAAMWRRPKTLTFTDRKLIFFLHKKRKKKHYKYLFISLQ
jgi:hypothetical protein